MSLQENSNLPTHAFCWIYSALGVCKPGSGRIFMVYNRGRITAAAPMAKIGSGYLSRLGLVGHGITDEVSGLIYRDTDSLDLLVKQLLETREPLALNRFAATDETIDMIKTIFRYKAYIRVIRSDLCPYVELHSGWCEPESQLSSRRRSDLKRSYRRAEKLGGIDTQILTPGPDNVSQLLDRAFAIEANSWKGRRGSALSCNTLLGDFFRCYADEASKDGSLRIAILKIGGIDAAMQIACHYQNSYWIYTKQSRWLSNKC